MNKKSQILITGGTGFIGANVARRCIAQGYENIHITTEVGADLWRINDSKHAVTIHELDIADGMAIKKTIGLIRPSYIFHLAAYGGSPHHTDREKIYAVNFNGTMNLLNACKEVGFECFINTGSSSEYGIKQHPMRETDVLEPVSDYAVAKAAATQYCLKQALFNTLPVYTVRPFSVYGDYEMPERLIPTIVQNALTNSPITLSSPQYVRDFIYIHDIVNLYCLIAEQKPHGAYIFNGGTGVQSSIQDVITTMKKIYPHPLTVTWGAHTSRPWEPEQWCANISKAREVLGWHPTYSLEDGLNATIAWMQQQQARPLDLLQKRDSLKIS